MSVSTLAFVAFSLVVARLLWFLHRELNSPLRNVRGPSFARLTRLWLVRCISRLRFHREIVELHHKFGPIVRLAPDVYSIDDVDAVKTIYGFGTKFTKSDWYSTWHNPEPGAESLFSDQDARRHMEKRKTFSFLYSMTSAASYEPFVEECNDLLSRHLHEAARRGGGTIDLSQWIKFYTFDVITALVYGRRFGFLDHGQDIRDTISEVDKVIRYSALVGVVPEIHPWIFNLAAMFPWSGIKGRLSIIDFVQRQVTARLENRRVRIAPLDDREKSTADLMDRLLDQGDRKQAENAVRDAFELGLTSIMAGFDSTALTLSTVLYFLLKNPACLAKLREEVIQTSPGAEQGGNVSFRAAQEMPYLHAVVKEAMRVHPGASLPFFRTVPVGGATLAGQFFPAGTDVGVSGWTVHFRREVFGQDADRFRPERWLEAEAEAEAGSRERLRRMEASYIPWGFGARSCLGKNIALLEMYKIIPRLVVEFDLQLDGQDHVLEAGGHIWVKPENFHVSVKKAV